MLAAGRHKAALTCFWDGAAGSRRHYLPAEPLLALFDREAAARARHSIMLDGRVQAPSKGRGARRPSSDERRARAQIFKSLNFRVKPTQEETSLSVGRKQNRYF
jgi:hypothetical protein